MKRWGLVGLLCLVTIIWGFAINAFGQARSGRGPTVTPGSSVRGTCVQDWDGFTIYVSSTGGSAHGRTLVCTSTQGSSVTGWKWRVLTVGTAEAN